MNFKVIKQEMAENISKIKQEAEKEYSIDINKQIMIGVKCSSKPIIIGAMDGGGDPIDLDKIIVREIKK